MSVETLHAPGSLEPIDGDPSGKHLLSMHQLAKADVYDYMDQAAVAEERLRSPIPQNRGFNLLPSTVLKAVMRQPSTRTGGSMTTAMDKLGGTGELISGMSASAEAKGESMADSWLAFATQCDILGTRTKEENGPHEAAAVIDEYVKAGKLWHGVPVINLGDGTNEHPTQALGDLFTIQQEHEAGWQLDELTLTLVGDHGRYRAFHSLMIGAKLLDIKVVAVESKVARVPEEYCEFLDDNLETTTELDDALATTDVLYIGRNPDEYANNDSSAEYHRSQGLARSYENWVIDKDRAQRMPETSVILHPRPRKNELQPDVDFDPRACDVTQMAHMIPMRMAIIARHMGVDLTQEAA